MYYLYHIPGKKIGVTRNLNTRVTLIQGYKEGEYEVLEQSEDVDYISNREIELQKSYGYKVDIRKYNELNTKSNKMKINSTEQTSTFSCPVDKLKGQLMDNIGLSWNTPHGDFTITSDNIPWIITNAKVSMFTKEKCYIYNKAFQGEFHDVVENFKDDEIETKEQNIFDLIRKWGKERGIHKRGTSQVQYIKLMEEAGELAEALLKDDDEEIVDAIGDMVVVLTNLAHLEGVRIEHCIESAYNVIKHRSDYEEAAAQGLLAGLNAGLKVQGKQAWCPRRDEAYIGVMVDDLISMGTMEPYRMFTSRAEYRLLLREDNADLRLTEKGREFGLVCDKRWQQFVEKREGIEVEKQRLSSTWVQPRTPEGDQVDAIVDQPISREYSLMDLIKRPNINYSDIAGIKGEASNNPQVAEQVEIQIKYSGYIDRQAEEIDRLRRYENTLLPEGFDYHGVEGLSNEVKQKLTDARPETLARASRVPGVTPAAISLLLIYLKKHGSLERAAASS